METALTVKPLRLIILNAKIPHLYATWEDSPAWLNNNISIQKLFFMHIQRGVLD